MSILVLSDLWPPFPGGAERLMFNLARDLMRRGEDVRVLTGYEIPLVMDGPPVTSMPIGIRAGHNQGWELICNELKRDRPDVIITHHLYAYEFAYELKETGIPVIHVVLNGPRLEFAYRAVYISNWVRMEAGNSRAEDLTLIPPALDDVVAPVHGDGIGFIKPIRHKGVELVYELAERLPNRLFVVLRGEWQDLELIRDDLENVYYMEPVVDIREFWQKCRLALVPSISEDAGTVAQEATANGLPCISSDVQGIRETNAGGIRLEASDIDAWQAAILSLDDQRVYARTVARQRARLAEHAGELDDFYRLVKETSW